MKIGRNDPCPCDSGKKYKKCCLNNDQTMPDGPNSFELKGKIAEQVVQELAFKSFFTDWCYSNPKWPDGKELCDLLVVFDDSAIIFSIKDLKLDKNNKYREREVRKNFNQLSGAYRHLFQLKKEIKLNNPRQGQEFFDPSKIKKIYMISIMMGDREESYSPLVELGSHPIHVMDREFLTIILKELDTITDFLTYLNKKEELLLKDKSLIINGGEEELLAWYLQKGNSFDDFEKSNFIAIEGGIWEALKTKPQYLAKKREDKVSYLWDSIINRAHEAGGEYEKIARELARSDRFERRCLGKTMYDAAIISHKNKTHPIFRRVLPAKGVTYCFMFADRRDVDGEERRAALGTFCYVARVRYSKNTKVIGIATEKRIERLSSYDFCLLQTKITKKDIEIVEQIQKDTGIMTNLQEQIFSEDEYPKD